MLKYIYNKTIFCKIFLFVLISDKRGEKVIKNYLCLVVSIILSPLHLLYIIIEKLVEIDFAAWMTMLWVFGLPFVYTRGNHPGFFFWLFWFIGIGVNYGMWAWACEVAEFIMSIPESIFQKCKVHADKCFHKATDKRKQDNGKTADANEKYSSAWQAYERYKRAANNQNSNSSHTSGYSNSNSNGYGNGNGYGNSNGNGNGNGYGNSNTYNSNQQNHQNQYQQKSSMPPVNEYSNAMKLFGLTGNNYSQEELKKKYRGLLKKYHPDNYNGDDTYAKKINEAYALLKK